MIKGFPLVTEGLISSSLNSLIKDEQDFIRMYIVDSVTALSKVQ
jgi:hypothetical protein